MDSNNALIQIGVLTAYVLVKQLGPGWTKARSRRPINHRQPHDVSRLPLLHAVTDIASYQSVGRLSDGRRWKEEAIPAWHEQLTSHKKGACCMRPQGMASGIWTDLSIRLFFCMQPDHVTLLSGQPARIQYPESDMESGTRMRAGKMLTLFRIVNASARPTLVRLHLVIHRSCRTNVCHKPTEKKALSLFRSSLPAVRTATAASPDHVR